MRKNIRTGIYCIENIINNKKYIGQSIDVDGRWSKHKSELNHGNHDNDYLQKAWNKYGEQNFQFSILECCDISELDEKEIYYIDLHNTLDRDCGYNLKSGGQASNQLSEEVKHKISESNKKAYESIELRELRKNDALNQWANPEIREKRIGKNNGMYGKTHTEEAKQKIRESKLGKHTCKNTTPVLCVELNKIFENAAIAAKEISNCSGNILKVCQGKRQTCGGYHWQFILGNNIS